MSSKLMMAFLLSAAVALLLQTENASAEKAVSSSHVEVFAKKYVNESSFEKKLIG